MKLTDALLGEHAVLYDLFDWGRNAATKDADARDLLPVVLAMESLLIAHARVEEDLLFPRLESHLGPMGPLAVMRAEHQEIEDLIESAKNEADLAALKRTLDRLLDVSFGHFQKEEIALFPMAQQFLGDAALTELGDQWAARRKVNIHSPGCMSAA